MLCYYRYSQYSLAHKSAPTNKTTIYTVLSHVGRTTPTLVDLYRTDFIRAACFMYQVLIFSRQERVLPSEEDPTLTTVTFEPTTYRRRAPRHPLQCTTRGTGGTAYWSKSVFYCMRRDNSLRTLQDYAYEIRSHERLRCMAAADRMGACKGDTGTIVETLLISGVRASMMTRIKTCRLVFESAHTL